MRKMRRQHNIDFLMMIEWNERMNWTMNGYIRYPLPPQPTNRMNKDPDWTALITLHLPCLDLATILCFPFPYFCFRCLRPDVCAGEEAFCFFVAQYGQSVVDWMDADMDNMDWGMDRWRWRLAFGFAGSVEMMIWGRVVMLGVWRRVSVGYGEMGDGIEGGSWWRME